MQILEGALAFAVAMILFSTVVSGVSETFLRVLNQRRSNIKKMVRKYLDQEFTKRFRKLMVQKHPDAFTLTPEENSKNSSEELGSDQKWKEFIGNIEALLTENPLHPEVHFKDPYADQNSDGTKNQAATPALPTLAQKKTKNFWNKTHSVENLSTYAFLQRLAKTEVGRLIVDSTDAKVSKLHLLQNMVRTFERYKAAGNEAYRKRGQSVALAFAVILAIGFNISAGRLFSHLVDSPEAREDLLAQAEQIVDENDTARTSLDDLIKQINEIETRQNASDSASSETTPDGAEAPTGDIDYEQLENIFADFKEDIAPLTSSTVLPIGPEYFPYACFTFFQNADGKFEWTAFSDEAELPQCDVFQEGQGNLDLLFWALNVLLAGILIGLGGPFWFRIFSFLSQLVSVASVFRGSGTSETMDSEAKDQPATGAAFSEALDEEDGGKSKGDLLSVFETAAGGKKGNALTP